MRWRTMTINFKEPGIRGISAMMYTLMNREVTWHLKWLLNCDIAGCNLSESHIFGKSICFLFCLGKLYS